jgi:hypothetical protein
MKMRTHPAVVSTRITYGQRARLERTAAELSKKTSQPLTVAELLRLAVENVTRRQFDAAALLVGMRAIDSHAPESPEDREELCKFLGLPDDATDDEITRAVQALLATAEPPAPAGATAGNADAPPPASAFRRELTRAERDYCAKHKLTPEQFAARKRDAVRTQPKKGK